MIHPRQFQVNEAWIAAKATDTPITLQEGVYDVFFIMDVGSTYVLGHAMANSAESSPPVREIDNIFKSAYSITHNWPSIIFIADSVDEINNFTVVARNKGINIERVQEKQLAEYLHPIKRHFTQASH